MAEVAALMAQADTQAGGRPEGPCPPRALDEIADRHCRSERGRAKSGRGHQGRRLRRRTRCLDGVKERIQQTIAAIGEATTPAAQRRRS